MTLLGPKPENEVPVFPTPWATDGATRIMDAAGHSVLYLESEHASEEEDIELTELIVKLINTHAVGPIPGESPDGCEYYIQEFESGIDPNVYRIDGVGNVRVQYYPGEEFHIDPGHSAQRVRANFPLKTEQSGF